jgi:hypothetical protein
METLVATIGGGTGFTATGSMLAPGVGPEPGGATGAPHFWQNLPSTAAPQFAQKAIFNRSVDSLYPKLPGLARPYGPLLHFTTESLTLP